MAFASAGKKLTKTWVNTMLQCLEKPCIPQRDEGNPPHEKMLQTKNGTSVSLLTENGIEKITLRNDTGQIIFEYQPETKKCCFTVPEGDLHFNAPAGNISFSSGRDIKMKCPGDIMVEGEGKIAMHSGMLSPGNAALVIDRQQLHLQGCEVAIVAEEGKFAFARTFLRSRQFAAKIERGRATLDDLEIVVETIRQKAKNVFQNVENLLQINSGRMRTFVRGLYNLKGDRTYIKAEKDIKLKGDKIHLR
jgi:hypothetical protein